MHPIELRDFSDSQSRGSLDKGIFCSIMHITDHFLLSTVQMLDRQESLLWSWFSVRDQHVKLLLNAANLYAKTYNGPRYDYLILTCNFGLFACLLGRLQRENEANFCPGINERTVSKARKAAAKCS